MKSKENLVFLGMMGSGKSSIGLLVAKRLKLDFIDIDNEIEKDFGEPIQKIFEIKGEDYFRKLEEKTTLKLIQNKESVIALGGGAFINSKIRREILRNCCSIWLNSKIEILIRRYKKNNKRPLLDLKNLESDVKKIFQARKKIYAQSNFKINCDNMKKEEIVQKILKLNESY